MFKRKKKLEAEIDLDAPLSPEADKFLGAATGEFNKKQEALRRDWRFDSYKATTGTKSRKTGALARLKNSVVRPGATGERDFPWQIPFAAVTTTCSLKKRRTRRPSVIAVKFQGTP